MPRCCCCCASCVIARCCSNCVRYRSSVTDAQYRPWPCRCSGSESMLVEGGSRAKVAGGARASMLVEGGSRPKLTGGGRAHMLFGYLRGTRSFAGPSRKAAQKAGLARAPSSSRLFLLAGRDSEYLFRAHDHVPLRENKRSQLLFAKSLGLRLKGHSLRLSGLRQSFFDAAAPAPLPNVRLGLL